jgi:serine/threonine-protein kinase
MAINAIPWAEVLVDGARVGETPIGNITVPIGLHEVLFRHPELGERRLSVTVTTREPLKVGVDLRSK